MRFVRYSPRCDLVYPASLSPPCCCLPTRNCADLDDYMSGYFVAGNSFFNTTCSFLGGGRDNTYLENSYNLTRGCPPIKIDQRCFGNTSAELPPIILKFLDRVPYNTSQVRDSGIEVGRLQGHCAVSIPVARFGSTLTPTFLTSLRTTLAGPSTTLL